MVLTLKTALNTTCAATLLKKVCLFTELDDDTINSIATLCIARRLPKGTIVCQENDIADTLYIVGSGELKVYLSDEQGQELILTTLDTECYFGELGILTNQTRAASVMVLDDCQLFSIKKCDFDSLLDNNPHITRKLLANLATFSKQQVNTIKAFAMKDVYGRLVALLEAKAITDEDGRQIVKPKMTQKLLAQRVGATRERVAKIMKDLASGGYINVQRDHIEITRKLPTSY